MTMDRSQIKLELKKWERFFEKVNGRKPNRADIKAAGEDIKSLYKKYFDPSNEVSKASLQKKPKESVVRSKSQACEPFLEKLKRNYSNMQFVKKTILKKKKKKDNEPELIVEADEPSIDPNGNLLTQLRILTELTDDLPDEQLPSPTITESTSSLLTPSFSSSLEFTSISIDSAPDAPTLVYSPGSQPSSQPLMPTILVNDSSHSLMEAVSTITLSMDEDNGLIELQTDGCNFISSAELSRVTGEDTSINSSSQFEATTAIDADLFAGDFDTDPLVLQVKECIEEKVEELEEEDAFEGCLLPLNYKRKRKSKLPTAKSIKKRNDENFVRVDLKKKSFASKGYKKLNVQKYKRKKYQNARRNKCYTCGEQGHWSKDCPLNLKKGENDEATTSEKSGTSDAPLNETIHQGEQATAHINNDTTGPKDPFMFDENEEASIPLLKINYK